jgi:hypothetical protein
MNPAQQQHGYQQQQRQQQQQQPQQQHASTAVKKLESISPSPTNTFSVPNSAHSSPLSSIATSPPTEVGTAAELTKLSSRNVALSTDRLRRPSTIQNPHLAFDPTIPLSERQVAEEHKSNKNTLERRSTLQQQMARTAKTHAEGQDGEGIDGGDGDEDDGAQSGTVRRMTVTDQQGLTGSLRGPVVRKRRSLHQGKSIQKKSLTRSPFSRVQVY